MDAAPRVSARLFSVIKGEPDDAPSRYTTFLIIQVIGVTIMVLFLMGGFTKFLYFATSMGFVASPAIAYYNYRAVTSADVAAEYRPERSMVIWSWTGITVLTAFALAFLWSSLG
jgi:Mn2+/Fe2+ NRAMP family transporter